jgi:predicted HTH transcriptional regulator
VLRTERLELVANGESSGVEFKRDDVRPEQLAKELVALANFEGGRLLLGVEDDGSISGIQRASGRHDRPGVDEAVRRPPQRPRGGVRPNRERVSIGDA